MNRSFRGMIPCNMTRLQGIFIAHPNLRSVIVAGSLICFAFFLYFCTPVVSGYFVF